MTNNLDIVPFSDAVLEAGAPLKPSEMMAWAKDDRSIELVFIDQVPPEYTGLKCGCLCYGCGQPVAAVNAGAKKYVLTPHFRHRERVPGLTCSIALAEKLIADRLEDLAGTELELPARSVKVSVRGLSGKEYSFEEVFPSEQVRVSAVQLTTHAQALVKLDDGRQVLVSLDGNFNSQERGIPAIVVRTDDPAIARMSPGELRKRITVLISAGIWEGPLFDPSSTDVRRKQLELEALEALDFIPEEAVAEIGRSPEPETLLHWTAKELLKEIPRIAVPGIRLPFLASYAKKGVTQRDCEVKGTTLDLSDVRLEARLGQTRPDVLANVTGIPTNIWDGPLAIEIAVSNKVSPDRANRIASEGVASLEIDLSMIERAFSRTMLKELLTEHAPQKHWVFHPGESKLAEAVSAKLRDAPDPEKDFEILVFEKAQTASVPLTLMLSRPTTANELAAKFEAPFIVLYPYLYGNLQDRGKYSEVYPLAKADVQKITIELASRGLPKVDVVGNAALASILWRLYALRRDSQTGPYPPTAGEILEESLKEEGLGINEGFHHLFLMAERVYQPKFNGYPRAGEAVKAWRARVYAGFQDPASPYYADYQYNTVLELFLPEMTERLQWRPRESLYDRMKKALANESHPYQQKDLEKAKTANKFIGQGSRKSLTNRYRVAAGDYANTGRYKATDVVFISAEGALPGRVQPNMDEIKKAIDAGATLVTDAWADRERPYNEGERAVAHFLRQSGYLDLENKGRWTPRRDPLQRSFTEC